MLARSKSAEFQQPPPLLSWVVTVSYYPATWRRIASIRPPKARIPGIKSSIAVLSPRLFCEMSPSAITSKGFLILGQELRL